MLVPTPPSLLNLGIPRPVDLTEPAQGAPGLRPEQFFAELDRLPKDVDLRWRSQEDRHALICTADRCSSATRQDRFHEPIGALPPGWARRICRITPERVAVAAVVEAVEHRLSGTAGTALGAPCDDEIVALAQVPVRQAGVRHLG